jgi:type II secretory pathway pseudopilin PulG
MKPNGFTVIELCVVITIVFILSMAGGHQFLQLLDRRAEFQIRAQTLHQMALAVKQLRTDSGEKNDRQMKDYLLSPVFVRNWRADFKLNEFGAEGRQVEIEANIFEPSAQNPSQTIKGMSWTKVY